PGDRARGLGGKLPAGARLCPASLAWGQELDPSVAITLVTTPVTSQTRVLRAWQEDNNPTTQLPPPWFPCWFPVKPGVVAAPGDRTQPHEELRNAKVLQFNRCRSRETSAQRPSSLNCHIEI